MAVMDEPMNCLIDAIRNVDVPAVKEILKSQSIDNINEFGGKPAPLCEACLVNSIEIVDLLLDNGADVNLTSIHDFIRPLHIACQQFDDNTDIVARLLDAGANINAQDEDRNTGLHLACTQANVEIARLLINSGANVNLEDNDRETPLIRACSSHQDELIEILLEHGAKPTSLCLMTCILRDFVRGVSLLYRVSPESELLDILNIVRRMKVLECRSDLLRPDVNIAFNEDEPSIRLPPLHVACAYPAFSSYNIVVCILKISPDVHRRDPGGYNSLQHACSNVNLSVVQVLLAYGANAVTDGWYPLWKYFPSLHQNNYHVFFRTLRLLLASGFHLDADSAAKFTAAAESVAPRLPKDEKELLHDLILRHSSIPLSLKELCRIKVREMIPVVIDKNVEKLNTHLPRNLLSYLLFHELIKPIPFD